MKNVITHTNVAAFLSGAATIRRPAFIWGGPGIGKSDAVRQFAATRDAELLTVILSQYDSVDLRGLPDMRDGLTVWNPPSTLPFKGNSRFDPTGSGYVLFLDELPQANSSVQNVAFQLALDRRIGEHHLMDNVIVVAAGNRMTDKANANRLATPLLNRFIHADLEVDFPAWRAYAVRAGFNPFVLAFLDMRPALLNTFEDGMIRLAGKDKIAIDHAFATPRTWAFASELLNHNADNSVIFQLICGAVSPSVGTEFFAFKELADQMPDMDDIINNPTTAEIPKNSSAMYAVSSALSNLITPTNADSLYEYIKRLPPEYQVRTIKDALARLPQLGQTQMFAKFGAMYVNLTHGS